MKILHVTECVGGGVARAIDRIPGAVPGHEHFLLSVRPDLQMPSGKGFTRSIVLPSGHLKRIFAVRRAVAEIRPDVIHAHSSWAGFYVRSTRIPGRIVYQPHGYALELGGVARRIVFTAAEWILARRRASVAVLSAHESDICERLNSRTRRVFVPNVPTIEPSPGLGNRSRSVVMVGRIGDQKDPEYFAALKRRVVTQDRTIEFRWIGDGDICKRRTLERAGVIVTGWLDDEELIDELQNAGVYAHSSKYEGFPLSVLDAAACDLAVLARAIPAFDGSPVAQFRNLGEHARAIVEFFSTSTSHRDLAARSVELLRIMSPGKQAAALLRLYDPLNPICDSFVATKSGEL